MTNRMSRTRVKIMRGAVVSYGHEAVNVQFEDSASTLHELSMDMGNAMYLLSLLKAYSSISTFPFQMLRVIRTQ